MKGTAAPITVSSYAPELLAPTRAPTLTSLLPVPMSCKTLAVPLG